MRLQPLYWLQASALRLKSYAVSPALLNCRGVLNLGCSPSNLCPTVTGALRPCAPATETLHPLDVATDPWANRTVPGLAGFPCAVAPEGTCPAELCAPGLSCYPLEALVSGGAPGGGMQARSSTGSRCSRTALVQQQATR